MMAKGVPERTEVGRDPGEDQAILTEQSSGIR